MRRIAWLGVALVLLAFWVWQQRPYAPASADAGASVPADTSSGRVSDTTVANNHWPAFLPPQALDTLRRIERGGPFDHRQDGATFQNRERRLPSQPRGYYREYTVPTLRSRDRGARRIVSGGDPPSEYFYTADHYRSFRRFTPSSLATTTGESSR